MAPFCNLFMERPSHIKNNHESSRHYELSRALARCRGWAPIFCWIAYSQRHGWEIFYVGRRKSGEIGGLSEGMSYTYNAYSISLTLSCTANAADIWSEYTGINEFSKKLIPWLLVCNEWVNVVVVPFNDATPSVSELHTLVTWKTNAMPQALECSVDFSQQSTDASVVVDWWHLTCRSHVIIGLQWYSR